MCRLCKTQDIKDGFTQAAWDILMHRHSVELNEKVLDAYRLSNVCGCLWSLILYA